MQDVPEASKESTTASKAMRQIQFESDSNHSTIGESPALFIDSEPGHAMDSSIPKPTFSRPSELSKLDDSGIEVVKIIEHPLRESAQKLREMGEDSSALTQEFTPRLFQHQQSDYYSQEIMRLSPTQQPDPQSQTSRIVDCYETQDLMRGHRTGKEQDFNSPALSINSKLELSLESSLHIGPSDKVRTSL